MNTLNQLDSGLLGSSEAVRALSKASTARILVFSDTHGHFAVVDSIIKRFGPECDCLLFAGDGMWDIVQYIENAQESTALREALPPVVAFVRGNGDGDEYRVSQSSSDDDLPGYLLTVPARQIVQACAHQILLVHGHHYSVDSGMEGLFHAAHALHCTIAVYGHTHIPVFRQSTRFFALNPGSASRPRGHSENSFAILHIDSSLEKPNVEFYHVNEKTLQILPAST